MARQKELLMSIPGWRRDQRGWNLSENKASDESLAFLSKLTALSYQPMILELMEIIKKNRELWS